MERRKTRGTVLIVEDDADIRKFLLNATQGMASYRALTATDSGEGLRRALTDRPDVILLDLTPPHFSGLELLDWLHRGDCNIPAIGLIAPGSERALRRALHLGAQNFLETPLSVDEVRSAIEHVLAEKYLQQEKENLIRALTRANMRLQRQVHNWIAINDIARTITSTLKEPDVLLRVMANVNRILQVGVGALLLLNQQTGELEPIVTLRGDTVHASGSQHLGSYHLRIAGWVARHGYPLLIPNVHQAPPVHVNPPSSFQSHSVLCVPLEVGGQVIGVLELVNKRDGTGSPIFTREDLKLLTALASWVTVAVENARLSQAMQEETTMTTLRQTVATLAHHINNSLMVFSLELDRAESEGSFDQQTTSDLITSARHCLREISDVIRTLDQLEEVQTVPYVGAIEMIDIGQPSPRR